MAIVGCIGNGFVVTVVTILRRRGHKSSVQLFLLHLAISDLMVCLLCIPLTIFSNFHYPTQYSSMDDGICKLSRFVQVKCLILKLSESGLRINRARTEKKERLRR